MKYKPRKKRNVGSFDLPSRKEVGMSPPLDKKINPFQYLYGKKTPTIRHRAEQLFQPIKCAQGKKNCFRMTRMSHGMCAQCFKVKNEKLAQK